MATSSVPDQVWNQHVEIIAQGVARERPIGHAGSPWA